MTRSLVRLAWRVSSATILALFALAGGLLAQDPPPEGSASASPVAEAAALLPQADEHELHYACALALAREGDLENAIASLETLASRPLPEPLATHVVRDVERLRCFDQLRARQLAALAASGGALRLVLDGREHAFHVAALEEDRVVFQSTVFGVSSLPLARLDSLQLAKQMPRDLDGATGRWGRLYPYVLVDKERGFQLLRRDCKGLDEAAELLEDAEQWYPHVVDLVDAAVLLEELARDARVGGSYATTLERVRGLLTRHGDLEPVQRRLPQLQALATACLQSTFRDGDLLDGLACTKQRQRDGAVRLVYAFDGPKELDDFELASGYPPERIAALPELSTPADQGRFELEKGELIVAGSKTWRHVLPFQGPITVRCRLRFEAPPPGGSPVCFWMIGACDDGQESYIALQELGTAMAIDRPRGSVAHAAADPGQPLTVGADYDLELACDGDTVRTRVNGAPAREVPAGWASRGEVFFLVHSDAPVRFDRIEIDVAPGGLTASGAWIEARLGELGFPASAVPEPEEATGVQ